VIDGPESRCSASAGFSVFLSLVLTLAALRHAHQLHLVFFASDVGAKGTDSPQSNKSSNKPAGTGFFLPLAMRSSDSTCQNERVNGRSKPNRRRNVSTPNIGLGNGAGDRNACSLRSNSSSNLRNGRRHTPDGQHRRFSFSIEEDCAADYSDYSQLADVQQGSGPRSKLAAFPASAYDTNAAAVAAALAATAAGQASRVTSMPQQLNLAAFTQLPPGLEQPMQQQGAAVPLHMRQQLPSPTVPLPNLGGSQSTSPRVSSSNGAVHDTSSGIAALSARLTAQQEPVACSTPISLDALQTFYGPSALEPVPSRVVEVLPAVDSSSNIGSLLLPMNSSNNTALPEQPAAAAAGRNSPGHATIASQLQAAAAADGSTHIYSQVSLNTWAVPQVPQVPSSAAAAAADGTTDHHSFDTVSSDLEESEDMIQKRIDQLLLQKQLLQLRQQHKQQQALLQLQQQQQEQALQQQLHMLQSGEHKAQHKQSKDLLQQQQQVLQVQSSNGSFTSMQPMQQQQLLQVQPSNGSFTSMQPMQQQQVMLQVQQSSNSFTQKSPEQLQHEMLQLQLQQLQLQQQQQQSVVPVTSPGHGLVRNSISAPQQLPSIGLLNGVVPGPACTSLQPAPAGTLPASSGGLRAFAGSATALSSLQGDVVPVMGAGDGSSFADLVQGLANGAAAGAAGLASWGSGQQLNAAAGDGAAANYNGLFGCSSGPPAVGDGVVSSTEGAWSFEGGLSFNQ
jgi:hypothetical protein